MTPEKFKSFIWTYIESKDIDALKKLLNDGDESLLVEVMEELSHEEMLIAYRVLTKERALLVFEQMEPPVQEQLLRSFTDEKAIDMVERMAPDDRVALFEELPATVAKKLLGALSSEEREMTNLLLGYEPQTAGRIMTPEYTRIRREWTVSEALAAIKTVALKKETIYTLYITDESKKLKGMLTLVDLIVAEPGDLVGDIMKEAVSVTTDTDQEEVALKLQDLDLLAIPVTDKEKRLVGIVTIDDAMDILEDEATEDMYIQAGLSTLKNKENDRSRTLIEGSLFEIWKVRLPILIMVLAGGFLAGLIMEGFEEVLDSVTVIAFFIPLIMDMGGSVGGQSTTIFARGVVLGHIKPGQFMKQLLKEATVGLSIGAVVGVFAFFAVWAWQGDMMIGLVVGIALMANCLIASSVGFLVPWVLIKIGADQAAGSGPIITSIKDISGLTVYFFLVSTLLGHLIY